MDRSGCKVRGTPTVARVDLGRPTNERRRPPPERTKALPSIVSSGFGHARKPSEAAGTALAVSQVVDRRTVQLKTSTAVARSFARLVQRST